MPRFEGFAPVFEGQYFTRFFVEFPVAFLGEFLNCVMDNFALK